jgi:hypothetical protein
MGHALRTALPAPSSRIRPGDLPYCRGAHTAHKSVCMHPAAALNVSSIVHHRHRHGKRSESDCVI